MNKLYFGDNLEIMKDLLKAHPQGFIDLIYIDPPFNSKRDYNVLFESIDMENTKAQKEAFSDTWSNVSYHDTLEEIHEIDLDLYTFLNSLDNIRIPKNAISYLSTMALRSWYMHKLLKDTGSFYLHCDPTMSHYLKIVCDLIFGNHFLNEVVWCYFTRHFAKSHFGRKHDIILLYSKTDNYTFNWHEVTRPLSESTIKKFKHIDENGHYRILGRGIKGSPIRSAKDVDPKWEQTNPELVVRDYLEDKVGVPIEDYWFINIINQASNERLGYPTQKPEALLERIVKSSSNEGDLVADFFCGCGTAIAVAQKLNRKWLGVDISHLAIKLITKRLTDRHGLDIRETFEIYGFPKDIDSAKELATGTRGGRLKFEEWIIEVMLHGVLNPRRNEAGFDGYLTFEMLNKKETVLIEVKSGSATLPQINHFIKTVDKMNAAIGLFVCFQEQITDKMIHAIKGEGYYRKDNFGTDFPKIQIVTVEDLMDNKLPKLPFVKFTTFKESDRMKEDDKQFELEL